MKKAFGVLILALSFSQASLAEELIDLKFSDLQKMAAVAIVAKEIASGIKGKAKDVSDLTLVSVSKDEIELGAVAPGYVKEDGIPNYCSVVLARATSSANYQVKSVNCSPWD